ncbi:LPXTG cell wall anchor domain-containing protein [Spirilliplanes yamanashiensis]|nr:LPXTG cell wall anchor domain-containing protein [Spirilliplanes yamanashiensis]MDP9815232.1 LPXTG-motif cell wall-anchored protein [Spirilliplanes yamanashiensis]
MYRKVSAGVLLAMALLVPAAPAAAQAGTPGLDASCQTVERKLFTDIRKLVTVDLDTATDDELLDVANRVLDAAKADKLPVLPRAMEQQLEDPAEELRAFLKQGMLNAWTADLRISIGRTMGGAGTNVRKASQEALDNATFDAYLAYLNEGLYAARALDCASQPSPTPTATPTATPSTTPTVAPVPTPSAGTDTPDGEGGGLPVTGSDTGMVAGVGGVLLLLGGAGYLIGRRRRSRFVA